MYTPAEGGTFPMPETTPVKESSGQFEFEQYVLEKGLPLVSFRPQYIYGEKANKHDYLDYYFEYLLKDSPVPIPGDGSQLVSMTNSKDVASLIASVVGNEEAAIEQRYFNCGTDQLVSYKEVADLCAKAAGISSAETESTGSEKGDFPFRATNFYVAPDMAKKKLNWTGAKNQLKEDLVWYYENYKERKPFIDAVIE
jgi:nucleoside-diphosphate-sugar epimerase